MLRLTVLTVLLALALSASATAAGLEQAERGVQIVRYAKRFVGVPYVWGGMSPRGFDCSGFTAYVYRRFGVSLPHYTVAQFRRGRSVRVRRLRPGDLVFFHGLGHVGLYVGRGRFIHAPRRGTRVRIDPLAGWYRSRLVGVRRFVRWE